MKINRTVLISAVIAGTITNAFAKSTPDAHAPIGVMGDHIHKKGSWMLSSRAMTMEMNQNFSGSNSITGSAGYMLEASKMTMDMYMLGAMYGITDKLTLMGMTSYKQNKMDMIRVMDGSVVKMKASGMGDSSLSALYQVYNETKGEGKANAHVGLGFWFPTGDIDKKNGMGRDHSMPMQLGSGTYDITPSVTYNHFINDLWSWGAQAKGTFHTGTNDAGYTLGDSLNLTTWVARNLNSNFSVSGRVNFNAWSGIDGVQTNGMFVVNPMLAAPTDPSNSGGMRTDLYLGVNYLHDSGIRLATELGKTVHQDLQGVQLGNDWSLNLGVQITW